MNWKENSELVNIKIEQDAKEDLKQIRDYISKDSIYYADKTVNEIINKTEYLLMFPYMGRKIPEFNDTNFRELIYKSYRILYKVNSKIYILKIFHHSRDILSSINIIKN